ncbi:SRPBCC family protein [Nocardia sp. NPDC051463]|uniref:SRPBCC family protein n=1 Tax=Nocardia sp. NPDC051463 TaxID=3154845 RepID=UPI003450B0E1
MIEAEVTVPVAPERAFAALAEGWLYASWVVGASHIREVDPGWPAVGTRIHYSLGLWPLTVQDVTEVRAVDPPRMLDLEARLWPLGSARIRLNLDEVSPGVTRIRMTEHAMRGPGQLVPKAVQSLLLQPRNQESLARLSDLIIGKSRPQR